jgi:hypothetical protein
MRIGKPEQGINSAILSAWSTDPACGRLEAQQELGEDTRGTATPPWHCLAWQLDKKDVVGSRTPSLGVCFQPLVFIFLFSSISLLTTRTAYADDVAIHVT